MQRGKKRKSLVSILARRIESCDLRNPNPDQLVDYLCSNYPDYNRASRRWLSKQVGNMLLESSSRKSTSISINVSDLHSIEKENDGPVRKKRKEKLDADEEKLQQLEMRHLMNKRWEGKDVADGEDDDDVSTSGDWIYGLEYEPEFDLMNSQLRQKYEASAKMVKDERATVESEMMEAVDDNTLQKYKTEFLKDGGGESGVRPVMVRKREDDGGGYQPMFKDLGGMRDVVKELKRKVIVPGSETNNRNLVTWSARLWNSSLIVPT